MATLVEPRPLTEDELKAVVDAEIQDASGELSDELTRARSDAMDRYLGEPDGMEMEGRSSLVTRDVLETIEWIMPSLMRMFAVEEAVVVDPVGEDDEEQAARETDYIRHVFFKNLPGFMILYTWFKDALLQKNGAVKAFVDTSDNTRRVEYTEATDDEYYALLADDNVEVIEHTESVVTGMDGMEYTLHDFVVHVTDTDDRIEVENVAPEDHLISRDARNINPKLARFNAHETEVTVSDLMQDGYSFDEIRRMEIGTVHGELGEEKLARNNLDGEHRWIDVTPVNQQMQTIKMRECFVYCDADGDGIAELLRVWRSGDWIEWDEIEDHPFSAITPMPLGHKYYGLSIDDLVGDIQQIRTNLLRTISDNNTAAINGRAYFNERVDPDDMATSLPWGTVAVSGEDPVAGAVLVDRPSGLGPEAYSLDEYIDKLLTRRVGDIQQQLDPSVLAQANTGVVLEMVNEARAKTEMIARIFAETGVRDLFRDIHKLSRKVAKTATSVKLRGEWVEVDPSQWQERTSFTIRVGLGNHTRAERLANLGQIQQMQTAAWGDPELRGRLVTEQNLYDTAAKIIEELGETPENHLTDPRMAPPPAQPQPDAQMMAVQATREIEQGKRMMEKYKADLDAQVKAREAQLREMQTANQAQMNQLTLQIKALETASKNAREKDKAVLDSGLRETQNQLQALELARKEQEHNQRVELEQYKAELSAATALTTAGGANGAQPADGEGDNGTVQATAEAAAVSAADQALAGIFDTLQRLQAQLNEPQDWVYDEAGKVVQIGRRKVTRADDGRVLRVG